ncbi:sortase [Frondihabitans australicus]|uniref:LPXTG-site transpeptidase (Sortase) family protein n=1 Tax=Frondihabitans australicus TaxID=386892 RepID=A0A495ICH0_9MICO|nr:sortase [Frondihabitans australicus]RKR73168.1 LPXTG-site transpeptidase (sortase) family protein [Frondihabitans australicus]
MTSSPLTASSGWSRDTASPAARALPVLGEPDRWRFGGSAVIVVGLLLLGFAVQFIGVSQISYLRDQQLELDSFRYQLANATAPVGQTGQDGRLVDPGTPVAILRAPSIGLNAVVLEGTTSDITRSGPGHRRDTPLPGQAGASVVYGRQTGYGGPFGQIGRLHVGDVLTTVTGQGRARYVVTDIRYPGDRVPQPLAAGAGRLTLVSGAGLPYLPDTVVRVDAKLVTKAAVTPQPVFSYAALSPQELTMAGDGDVWPFVVLGLIALAGMVALFAVGMRLWGRRQTLVVAVPVVLAVGLFAAGQLTVLLPNLM